MTTIHDTAIEAIASRFGHPVTMVTRAAVVIERMADARGYLPDTITASLFEMLCACRNEYECAAIQDISQRALDAIVTEMMR